DITHQKSRKANKMEFHTGLIEEKDPYAEYFSQCQRNLERYERYFFSDAVKSNNHLSKTYKDFQWWISNFRETYTKIGEFKDTVETETGEFVYEELNTKFNKYNKVTGRT